MAAIPLPPKKSPEEGCQAQKKFPEEKIQLALQAAREGKEHPCFVDAAHFVMGNFLAAARAVARLFLRGGSGRPRCHALAAWNAMRPTGSSR